MVFLISGELMKAFGLQENKEPHDKDEGPAEYISYWKPNITINLVDDFTRYSQNPICLSVLFVSHTGFYMFIKIYLCSFQLLNLALLMA